MANILSHPEVQDVIGVLFDKLLNESGRGAILIGTSHVEEHLTKLIETVMPSDKKAYRTRLLNYPGPISSFSAKIELAHAFRLIPVTLYDSLNALRKIRNEAAHSSSTFSLIEIADKLRLVYSLGPSVPEIVKSEATEAMLKIKLENIRQIFDENQVDEESRRKLIEELVADKKRMASLESQVPHWELIYGLSLVCGFIVHEREQISILIKKGSTWGSLIEGLKKKE